MWSKPQARRGPRPRLDNNTTLHEEESLSSQELGTSMWGESRTGSRLSGWEEAGEEAKTETVLREAAPWDQSPTFQAALYHHRDLTRNCTMYNRRITLAGGVGWRVGSRKQATITSSSTPVLTLNYPRGACGKKFKALGH